MSLLARVVNHKLFLVVLGTLLTVGVGTWLSERFQSETFEREKYFQIAQWRLAQYDRLINNISADINERFFGLRRVLWAAKSGDVARFNDIYEEYYKSVATWNVNLYGHYDRLNRFGGQGLSAQFFGDRPSDSTSPYSLHSWFRYLHPYAESLRRCVNIPGCDIDEKYEPLKAKVDEFDHITDRFVLKLSSSWNTSLDSLLTQPERDWLR